MIYLMFEAIKKNYKYLLGLHLYFIYLNFQAKKNYHKYLLVYLGDIAS